MDRPELLMKMGFEHLIETTEFFNHAAILYSQRKASADAENEANVKKAIGLLYQAWDEVSAIWENDINV